MTPEPGICICRCVGIDEATLVAAIDAGASSLDDLKRRTFAGMGFCQGAYCLHEMTRLLSERTGKPVAAFRPMTMQPPVGGVTLAVLAAAAPSEE